MLVNCPKCGFSQPIDKYCASCGIDIDNYKPTRLARTQNILSHNYFVYFITAIIVIGSFLVIRHNTRPVLSNSEVRLYKADGNKDLTSKTKSDFNGNAVAPTETTIPANELAAQETQLNLNDSNTNHAASTTSSAPDLSSTTRTDLQARSNPNDPNANDSRLQAQDYDTLGEPSIQAKIIFTEVSTSEMQKIKKTYKPGDYSWGFIPKNMRPVDSTLQTWTKNLDNQSEFQLFAGYNGKSDRDPHLGLNLKIEVQDFIENSLIKGFFYIQKNFREQNGNLNKSTYSSEFEVPFDQLLYIYGVLPHNARFEDNELVAGDSYLQIYKKNHFSKQQSEFTIYIDFDKPIVNNNGRGQ